MPKGYLAKLSPSEFRKVSKRIVREYTTTKATTMTLSKKYYSSTLTIAKILRSAGVEPNKKGVNANHWRLTLETANNGNHCHHRKMHREPLWLAQKRRCAICRVKLPFNLAFVDHCHTTAKIRGVLCNSCNTGLGAFKDDITAMKRAVRYLAKYAD